MAKLQNYEVIEDRIDENEDQLFNVLVELNELFNVGLDFESISHSELINVTRYELLTILKEFKGVE